MSGLVLLKSIIFYLEVTKIVNRNISQMDKRLEELPKLAEGVKKENKKYFANLKKENS